MQKILVVDDETVLVEAYQMVLEKEGFVTKGAFDGEEALKVAEEFKPDLILLDLLMPKKNGIEFLRDYKLLDDHPDVKVIVFSNLDMHKEVEEAYQLGAHKYVLKAWSTPKTLVSIVKEVLAEKPAKK